MSAKAMRHWYRKYQPWFIWGLGASFFFAEYFARVDPSIIVSQLERYYHVGAYALGSMSAMFYYPYIIMQIPVGSLVDRFGPHRLMTVMALLCGFGAMLFSHAHSLFIAEVARAIMGFSAAFAFVGALKLATLWFEPRKLGLLSGLTQGSGMLGAAIGGGAFSYLVAAYGWQATIMFIGLILVFIGIMIGLFVRDRRPSLLSYRTKPEYNTLSVVEGLKIVFRNPQIWINAAYAGLLYAPTGVFAELWGPSFMHRVYGMKDTTASVAVSLIFLGWAVGGPSIGWLSDYIGRRKPMMFFSAVASLLMLIIVLYGISFSFMPTWVVFVALFVYGICNTGVAIAYAVAGEITPLPTAGLAVAFTNMASIGVAAVLQQVCGWMLTKAWSGKYMKGVPFYASSDYKHAMFILPFCLVLCFILVFFIRETNCIRK